VYASLKTPPKNPVGKKGRRKEYITRASRDAPVASLKTLHEKTQWEKLTKGKKEYNSFDLQDLVSRTNMRSLGLQDLLIFRIVCDLRDHNCGL
jgi:hypothetical protein